MDLWDLPKSLQKAIINYSKARAVYVAYRKAGYSKATAASGCSPPRRFPFL